MRKRFILLVTILLVSTAFLITPPPSVKSEDSGSNFTRWNDDFYDYWGIDFTLSTNVQLDRTNGWATTSNHSVIISREIFIREDYMWSSVLISLSGGDGNITISILDGCTLRPVSD